jgi:deazaflavin-dependent oxidoreductase (nitroreductase family)
MRVSNAKATAELGWRPLYPKLPRRRPRHGRGDEGGAMPIPRTVGRWNKVGLNRVTRRIAPWLPGFGVVEHRGRRSGRRYRTPVNVFATEGGYRFALTYGPDTDWVKNVLAAGGCELRTRGRTIRLVAPRLYHDERRQGIRPLERQILRLLGVADFLSLRVADQPVAEARSGLPATPSGSRRPTSGRARPRMSRAS